MGILDKYDEYLRTADDRQETSDNQTEDEYLRNAILARDLRHGLPVNLTLDKRFVGLRDALAGRDLFEAVSLSDFFPSVGDRRARKRRRRAVEALLKKGFPRRLTHLGLGGKPIQEYVWLIPKAGDLRDSVPVDLTGGEEEEDSNDDDFGDLDGAGLVHVETRWTEAAIMARNNKTKELVDLAPAKRRVASRAMVAAVARRLGPLAAGIPKATLNSMYSEMTGIPTPNSHGAAGKDQRSRVLQSFPLKMAQGAVNMAATTIGKARGMASQAKGVAMEALGEAKTIVQEMRKSGLGGVWGLLKGGR
jgi:hypothetical protein